MSAVFHFNNIQVKIVTAAKSSSTDNIVLSSDSVYGGKYWFKSYDATKHLKSIKGDVVFGNGKFIIPVVDDRHATSEDGINWTLSQVASGFTNLIYGDGVFCSLSGNSKNLLAIHSSDGKKWSFSQPKCLKQSQLVEEYNTLAYGSSKFIYLSSGHTFYSTNGKDWKEQKNNIALHKSASISYDGKGFLVTMGSLDSDHCDFKVLSSVDAFEWHETNAPFKADDIWDLQIANGNNVYVALQTCSLSSSSKLYWSSDFNNWNEVKVPYLNGKLSFGGNQFFASNNTGLYHSVSGADWKLTRFVSSSLNNVTSNVCYGNGVHVMYAKDHPEALPIYYSKIFNFNEIRFHNLNANCATTDYIDIKTGVINSNSTISNDLGGRTNVIFGGNLNYISEGLYSNITGGSNNTLTGKYSAIVNGYNASNNADNSTVIGSSINSGNNSHIIGTGNNNMRDNAIIIGTNLTPVTGNMTIVNSLHIANIPTVKPDAKGIVWNDNNTLKIS